MNAALSITAAALIGGLLGNLAVVVAARRNQAQPVEQEPEAELELVTLLLHHPEEFLRVESELSYLDFSHPAAITAYESLRAAALAAGLDQRRYTGDDVDEMNAVIAEVRNDATLRAVLDGSLAPALAALDEAVPATLSDEEIDALEGEKLQVAVLTSGQKVLTAAAGREQNTNRSAFITDVTTGKVTRAMTVLSKTRRINAIVLAAVAAVVGTLAVVSSFTSFGAQALALGSLAALIFVSVEVAAVDLDTFYLDSPVFAVAGIIAWALAVGAALVEHNPGRLIAGVATALAIALTFEIMARLFAIFRGHTQGAGDTWIVLITAGVPAALLGSWQVGLYGVLAGCLITIAFWSIQRARGLADTDTPMAFGPYLAAGWVVSMAWWLLTTTQSLHFH